MEKEASCCLRAPNVDLSLKEKNQFPHRNKQYLCCSSKAVALRAHREICTACFLHLLEHRVSTLWLFNSFWTHESQTLCPVHKHFITSLNSALTTIKDISKHTPYFFLEEIILFTPLNLSDSFSYLFFLLGKNP